MVKIVNTLGSTSLPRPLQQSVLAMLEFVPVFNLAKKKLPRPRCPTSTKDLKVVANLACGLYKAGLTGGAACASDGDSISSRNRAAAKSLFVSIVKKIASCTHVAPERLKLQRWTPDSVSKFLHAVLASYAVDPVSKRQLLNNLAPLLSKFTFSDEELERLFHGLAEVAKGRNGPKILEDEAYATFLRSTFAAVPALLTCMENPHSSKRLLPLAVAGLRVCKEAQCLPPGLDCVLEYVKKHVDELDAVPNGMCYVVSFLTMLWPPLYRDLIPGADDSLRGAIQLLIKSLMERAQSKMDVHASVTVAYLFFHHHVFATTSTRESTIECPTFAHLLHEAARSEHFDKAALDMLMRIDSYACVLQIRLPVYFNFNRWHRNMKRLGTGGPSDDSTSYLEKSVGATLDVMASKITGFKCEHSPTELNGLMKMDFRITTKNGHRVVLEVDGPQHYWRHVGSDGPMTTIEGSVNGTTIMRNKVLTALGYRVIYVPFYAWSKLETESACITYLAALLVRSGCLSKDDVGKLEVDSVLYGKFTSNESIKACVIVPTKEQIAAASKISPDAGNSKVPSTRPTYMYSKESLILCAETAATAAAMGSATRDTDIIRDLTKYGLFSPGSAHLSIKELRSSRRASGRSLSPAAALHPNPPRIVEVVRPTQTKQVYTATARRTHSGRTIIQAPTEPDPAR